MKPGVLPLVLLALATACAAVRTVPELTPDLFARGGALGLDSAEIRAGREAFVRQCGRCHAHPDPRDTPREGWDAVLERMGEKSHSSPRERSAIRAFVQSASAP